jgi:hypothetical protein
MEELNGSEEAVFNIPNTSANRAIIASNVLVNVLYNGSVIYPGLLTGAKYTSTNLQCYVYNPVFVALKQATATLTKVYTSVAANSILADIVACTSGVSIGSCPSTAVSLTFKNSNAFDALVALAKGLGLYYWGVSAGGGSTNGTINIGTRDATTYTPSIYEQSTSRGIDRSKQYSKVIINGVSNSTGQPIQGTAGSGGAVKTFTDKKTSDVATLNALAAYKLLTLNNPSTGNPLSILTDTAAAWHPGQYVTVSRSDLNLIGTLIIQRITKGPVLSTVEVDIPVNQDDVYLQDVTEQTSDLGIQPISTGQVVGSLPTSQLSGSLTAFGTMSQGNDSAKPTAGTSGRIYWAVDTNKIYLDTGTTWQFIGSSVLGTLTGTISTGVLTGALTAFSIMSQGLDASKPSAGTAGRIYYATDTNKTYLDTGSAWSFVGTPLLGTMSGSITASQIAANAVTANAIAANAVTANAIAAGSISAGHLSAGCVTANALAAGAVTATAIAANTITAAQITTAMITGLTIQSTTTSNNGTCYVLMGHYTDADKTNNYNLIVVGEQLRFYTPTAGSDVSTMHAMGVLTASSTTFSIGITGSYSTGILQLSGGTASGGGINLQFGSHGVLQLSGSAGTSGYVLTSQGAGLPPIWSAGTWNGGAVTNPIIISYNDNNLILQAGSGVAARMKFESNGMADGANGTWYLGTDPSSYAMRWSTRVSNNWYDRMILDQAGDLYVAGKLQFAPYFNIGSGSSMTFSTNSLGGAGAGTGYTILFDNTMYVAGDTGNICYVFGTSATMTFTVSNGVKLTLDNLGNVKANNDVYATHHVMNADTTANFTNWSSTLYNDNGVGTRATVSGITSSGDLYTPRSLQVAGGIQFSYGSASVCLVWSNNHVLSLIADSSSPFAYLCNKDPRTGATITAYTAYFGALDLGAVFCQYINPIGTTTTVTICGSTIFGSTNVDLTAYIRLGEGYHVDFRNNGSVGRNYIAWSNDNSLDGLQFVSNLGCQWYCTTYSRYNMQLDGGGNLWIRGKITQAGCLPVGTPLASVLSYLDSCQNVEWRETQTEVDALGKVALYDHPRIDELEAQILQLQAQIAKLQGGV